ncbi:MAG: hypothetical protein ABUT39_17030 [Acidobacteriota bacterium]
MRSIRPALRSLRTTLDLLLGKRLRLFAVADAMIVAWTFLGMLIDAGDEPQAMYRQVVLVPMLILGLPALAGLVEVERRAGCLDLALSSPAVERYFLRRAFAVSLVMTLQGWLLMLVTWLREERSFPLVSCLAQVAIVSLFLGALALFWAVRLKTAGGVWIASIATALALQRWFFHNPVPDRHFGVHAALFPREEALIDWSASVAVLGSATVLLYFYARRRLRRPETMIA